MYKTFRINIKTTSGLQEAGWKQVIVDESAAADGDGSGTLAGPGMVRRFLEILWYLLTFWRDRTAPGPSRQAPARTPGTLTFSGPGKTQTIVVPATFDRSTAGVTAINGRFVDGFFVFTCKLTLNGDGLCGTVFWGTFPPGKPGYDDGTEGYVEEEGSGG